MTVAENGKKIGQKGMVASPRFDSTGPTLADVIFGTTLDALLFVQKFKSVNISE